MTEPVITRIQGMKGVTGVEIVMYSDDLTLMVDYGASQADRRAALRGVKLAICAIEEWCRESNMTLSAEKCTYSAFGEKEDVDICVGSTKLARASTVKLLGVMHSEEGAASAAEGGNSSLYADHIPYIEKKCKGRI